MKIFAINPGSTSTKIAVFDDLMQVFAKTIRHSVEHLNNFRMTFDQYDFRKKIILDSLKEASIDVESFDAVVGRGGLLKPIPGGVYRVSDAMIEDLRIGVLGEHASNLGGILAREIAKAAGKQTEAYIVDPVVVDELDDLARFSGRPELPRMSIFHALNQKAVARRYARDINRKYESLNLIVVHLGGGITVGMHKNGRVIDVNNGLDGDGPFSPERAGSLPVGQIVKMCFSGKYQLHHVRKMITGNGGIVSYLGTNSATEVEEMIKRDNKKAEQVFRAMAYQINKEIGAVATIVNGKVDAILITGGLAHSEMLVQWVRNGVEFLAPVKIYPGEDEMQALAEGVYYGLKGEIHIKEYT